MSVVAYIKGPGKDAAGERFSAAVKLVEVRERRTFPGDRDLVQAQERYTVAVQRYENGLKAFLAKRWH